MVYFSDRVPGQNRDPNLLPDLNLMKMKWSSLMKNYHLLIRKTRKRRAKRRKNVVVRYWLFLNLKFVWKTYLLYKNGRIIMKFYYLFFIIIFQPSSVSEENRTKEKKKDKEKKSRSDSGNDKKNKEDGEWSEYELERRRRLLLEQLAEEHQWFITSIFLLFFCLSVPFFDRSFH